MRLACCILVIENKRHRIISIIVDSIYETSWHWPYDNLFWDKFLCLKLIVHYRAELVCIVALDASVSTSYYEGNLCDWSFPTAEIFTDRRLHLELPMVVCNLLEVSLLLSCSPICRDKLPFSINYNSKVTI